MGTGVDSVAPGVRLVRKDRGDTRANRVRRPVGLPDHGGVADADPRDVGDGVQRSRGQAADPHPRLAGTGRRHGAGCYRLSDGRCVVAASRIETVMAVLTLGVSFRRAPLELLEQLAFADDDLAKTYRRALDQEGVGEAVILSTCNRVEITADVTSYHGGFLALKRLFAEAHGVGPEALAEPLYSHYEQDAADHLFAVAAGLDSMVLGETQIHAQVREALRRAEREHAAGPRLTALFHAASR